MYSSILRLGFAGTALLCFACTDDGGGGASKDDAGTDAATGTPHFSFFVTSLRAMQRLANDPSGFGGDLTFGETGEGAGLRGADKICASIAETTMPGAGAKEWRAFLSATAGGEDGGPVHAIDRVGDGPWYDRLGRVVAMSRADIDQERPKGANPAILDDLPNEDGVPNHAPDPTAGEVDNHDILTGSDVHGKLFGDVKTTCNDWTSSIGRDGTPRVGHSWWRKGFEGDGGLHRGPRIEIDGGFGGPPVFRDGGPGVFPPPPGDGGIRGGGPRPVGDGGFVTWPPSGAFDGAGPPAMGSGNSWMSALDEAGCAPGVNIVEMGPPNPNDPTVGSGGGYGAIYCLALTP